MNIKNEMTWVMGVIGNNGSQGNNQLNTMVIFEEPA
jgi:hypothetical protein